ncbi:hypothetical protein Arno162_52 [Pectobacterium phage Arno162]|uniref:Uncharacterized protein n=1 Tax=Pectobacterium phage Arno162 TaxID=2500577 RepID=A0A678ZRI2_9CAUD|nr:hypothetical protein Arno162_52 [Pectobacterium phage Arno162]
MLSATEARLKSKSILDSKFLGLQCEMQLSIDKAIENGDMSASIYGNFSSQGILHIEKVYTEAGYKVTKNSDLRGEKTITVNW